MNIYEMYVANGNRAGFFVCRNSWNLEGSAALVVSVGGRIEGKLSGEPPYYGNPVVLADVVYANRPDRPVLHNQKLGCPGTYAYTRISPPSWWPDYKWRGELSKA